MAKENRKEKETTTKSVKLLIFIPSPRDLRQFHQAISKIKHDKLWVKYTPYKLDPYGQAKRFFMEHPEYTHFAICPDDLMVTARGVEKLWKHARKYDVIGGVCNVNIEDLHRTGNLAITRNLPTLERAGRVYAWIKRHELPKNIIIPVPWSGTAFMIMSRKVVEKMTFRGDGPANNDVGFSYDVGIAHELVDNKIKQYVDTGVFFKHYRVPFAKILNIHEPQTWFDTKNGREFSGEPFQPELINIADIDEILYTKQTIRPDKNTHVLSCTLCGGCVEGKDFEEMKSALDHGIGLRRNRPCPAHQKTLQWDGQQIYDDVGRLLIR